MVHVPLTTPPGMFVCEKAVSDIAADSRKKKKGLALLIKLVLMTASVSWYSSNENTT